MARTLLALLRLLPLFPIVGGALLLQPRAPARALRATAVQMNGKVEEIGKKEWCFKVESSSCLVIVLFYARWCRNCKAIEPIYKRMAREFPDVRFYKVNFKQETELCYKERVFSFPTVHFYHSDVGRICRYVLKAGDAEAKLRAELARLLSNEQEQLELLRRIRTEALSPVVRYKDLVSALQGLADFSAAGASTPNSNMAGLREAVEADEKRLAELEELFGWIDADGDGKLALEELEAAAAALGKSSAATAEKMLARIKEQTRGTPLSVDLATFVNLMTAKAVSDFTSPEKELLPAFEALDVDGDGRITQEELIATIENFCASVPNAEGCDISQRTLALKEAFDAFSDQDQLLDYERFVEMVAARSEQEACELPEEEYSTIFGVL
ncbi:hypothetical protein AB1Y20_007640 [Prymnesium parvum]|uniref:Calmodulin n=1 Tax=Prymnesium parvum TaxID=97485 RepID=A0AB34IXI7_PRYPA|mmetsp:Transcript_16171/g.40736  ORF Transcript_16171/g.40736 Transcript_16171/m.40736 type:complete len:385 (+) Transcript_16171:18-1172(+)